MIVVKFVECYGVAAHKLLEEIHTAPQLLYYKVGISDDSPTYDRLRIVVMEYLDENQTQKFDPLPPTFLEDAQRILSNLPDDNFDYLHNGSSHSKNGVRSLPNVCILL